MEVFVVDNNSVDGSVDMIKEKFSAVKLIENHENRGFARANNQAIRESSGKYVLLLNPDTVVEEDTFCKTIDFMETHPDAGGMGVKMVDGKGRFLPESKRGLPTPSVAFYKIFGLSKLFPKSPVFGKYHLGFLDKDKEHEIDILSGAFMMLRRDALNKTGFLDEDFFMYGEDIDISYRIKKAGYKNYYYPGTRIIHYKGESTKKSSINYVFVFYNAMIIFARKHFTQKNARLFSSLIQLAVFLRAFIALAARFVQWIFLPLIDSIMIYTGIFFIANYWEAHVIFIKGGSYPIEFYTIAIPAYIIVWLFSTYFSGGYDKPIRTSKIFQGLLIGTVLILTIYALLGEEMRFSRALILLGSAWALVSMLCVRFVLSLLKVKSYSLRGSKNKRFVIIGDEIEALRVSELLKKTVFSPGFIGLINIEDSFSQEKGFVGNISQLADIIYIYKIDEVIFCSKSLPPQFIIDKMSDLQHANIDFKIAPPESMSIIGSNSINTNGELYVLNINTISKASNKRNKRLVDVLFCLGFLVFYPLLFVFTKNPLGFFVNIFSVFFGIKSWVGYQNISKPTMEQKLPHIRPGVLFPVDSIRKQHISDDIAGSLNILYAKDYKIRNDVNIILKGFKNLGRR
jgi:GT2 family glycosyltransferase